MTAISTLTVNIGGNIRGVQEAFRKVSSQAQSLGRTISSVGRTMTAGITAPIGALATLSTHLADVQQQAERGLAAAIRAAGGDAASALPQFKAFASELQAITTVGDEASLAMAQTAISMGLSEEQAMRATRNAIALGKAFNINERSAIRYTAALEEGDSTMLNRYIPTLRNIEDENERAAEAQKILSEAFSIAREEATAGLGPLRQLKNQVGDLLETFGDVVLRAINPFIQNLRQLVGTLQELSPEVRTQIVLFAGLAAAIGPALIGVGLLVKVIGIAIGALAPLVGLIKGIGSALIAVVSPVGLVVAALAGLGVAAYLFRDEVADALGVARDFIMRRFIEPVIRSFDAFVEGWKYNFRVARDFLRDNFVAPVTAGIQKFLGFFADAFDTLISAPRAFLEFFGLEVPQGVENAVASIREKLTGMADGVSGAFDSAKEAGSAFAIDLKQVIGNGLEAGGDFAAEFASRFTAELQRIRASLASLFPDLNLPEIAAPEFEAVASSSEDAADDISKNFEAARDGISRSIGDAVVRGKNLFESLREIALNIASDIISAFARTQLFGAAASGTGGLLGGLFAASASGGRVNRTTTVGERGDETIVGRGLFIPAGPSTVRNAANTHSGSGQTVNQTINIPLAFPPQLEAFVRNIAGPAGRDAAMQVLQARNGRI